MKYKTELQAKRAMRSQQNAYQRRAMTQVAIRFHNESDADILKKLGSVENKADYIRKLIREDIARDGGTEDPSGND